MFRCKRLRSTIAIASIGELKSNVPNLQNIRIKKEDNVDAIIVCWCCNSKFDGKYIECRLFLSSKFRVAFEAQVLYGTILD